MAKRILLIDDDYEEADIFKEAVKEADQQAIFSYLPDCAEALRQLKEKLLPTPSLIFLDINMPLMNGLDCLKELKKADNLRHVPIIMYSTSRKPEDINTAMRLGAWAFWTKPNTHFDLLKKIKNLINSVLFS